MKPSPRLESGRGPRAGARARRGRAAALAATAAALIHPACRAETLAEAIALAYQSNPTLQSERAQQRALDETYVQARAGWRPTLSAGAALSHGQSLQPNLFTRPTEQDRNTGQALLSASQPLYTGGRTAAEVAAALAQVRAGRERLRSVENAVLFSVIQAYCDVTRDRDVLAIQRDSLAALTDASDEIRARYEAGATTSTDVAQAAAQVQAARALFNSAQAQLGVGVAEYVAAVGQSPGTLPPPPPLAAVPATIDEAFEAGDASSPALGEARLSEAAQRERVRAARAAQRPTVGLTGAYGESSLDTPFRQDAYDHAATATVTFSLPLYTGGVTSSQIRQAVDNENAQRIQIEATRRSVVQSIAQAWSQRYGAHLNVAVDEAQVAVAKAAYEGMRTEFRAGLRATLDVLIAEQVLRDAEVAAVQAHHDEYVDEAALLGAVGRLEAGIVVEGVPLYSAEAAFRRVRGKGGVPWERVPEALDALGGPGLDRPRPVPRPPAAPGPVRMTPAAPPPGGAP